MAHDPNEGKRKPDEIRRKARVGEADVIELKTAILGGASRRRLGIRRQDRGRGLGQKLGSDRQVLSSVVPMGAIPARLLGNIQGFVGPPDETLFILANPDLSDPRARRHAKFFAFEGDAVFVD